MQRDGQHDALTESTVGRHEHRTLRQTGVGLDLGRVLVRQAQAVDHEGGSIGRARAFVGLDAFTAPSGVTGHGMHRDRMILRHQARGDQRAQQRDRAGRIAPGIGHPGRGRDPRGLRRLHLGKTVGPSGIGPMCRTGIDDPHLRMRNSGHGLARCRIGQTQDRDIAAVDGLRSPMRILAPPVGQGQQRNIGAPFQPAEDLQAGGALVAIDENSGFHGDP